MSAHRQNDARRTANQHGKILDSMTLALRERPVSTEQVDAAVEQIEENCSAPACTKSTHAAWGNWLFKS